MRRAEIRHAREKLQLEKIERKEQVDRLRLEFQEFVHRKVARVVEEIDDLKKNEERDEILHRQMIEYVVKDLQDLREDLLGIHHSWGALSAACLAPPIGDSSSEEEFG